MHNHESKSFDASAQAFSDFRAMNCPANPTTHAEIAARYAEQARGAAKKQGRSRPPISLLRLAELERIFKDRWGKYVPDTPEGRDAVSVYCAHCAWHKSMDRFYGYVRVQVAWMPWDEAEAIADRESRSQWPDADALGWRLQLTPEERKRLGIGSIAPVGSSPRKRKTLRKAAARERMAGQRRREGATPRAEYEAASISGQKPWESLGWSRAKWYRKRSANAKTNAKSETSAFAPSSLDTPANGRVSPGPLNGLPLGGVNTSDGARATARPHTFKKTASQVARPEAASPCEPLPRPLARASSHKVPRPAENLAGEARQAGKPKALAMTAETPVPAPAALIWKPICRDIAPELCAEFAQVSTKSTRVGDRQSSLRVGYVVEFKSGRWYLSFDGTPIGSFESIDLAKECAEARPTGPKVAPPRNFLQEFRRWKTRGTT